MILGPTIAGVSTMRRSLGSKSNGCPITPFRKNPSNSHSGRPVEGLTTEETIEFQAIDALPPIDDNGKPAWTFEGEPITGREKRWLELYAKTGGTLKSQVK
jgi:hypothetical protein